MIGILSTVMQSASAIQVQRTATGYVLVFDTPTGKTCWGIPQTVDLSKFPTTPMNVEDVIKQYNWSAPTGEQLTVCQALTAEKWTVQPWRSATSRPVYALDPTGKKIDTRIDAVNVGVSCGAYVQAYSATITKLTWRMVTGNHGKQGAAVCQRQN